MMTRWIRPVMGLALTAVLAGCGHGSPQVPIAAPCAVRGRITFAGNTPLRGGMVVFTPVEVKAGGKVRYEGTGLVDAQGQYQIGFNGDSSGVPAGQYKVTIKPRDYQELRPSNSSRIPERYRQSSTTPLEVSVQEEPNTFDFVLQ